MGEKGGIADLNLPNAPVPLNFLRGFSGRIEFKGSGGLLDAIKTQATNVIAIVSGLVFISESCMSRLG